MKNKLTGLLLLSTLVLGVVCTWQWRQLQEQRQHLSSVEAARRTDLTGREEQEARLKESERVRAKLERDLQEFAAVTALLRSTESKQASNVTAMTRSLHPDAENGPEAGG